MKNLRVRLPEQTHNRVQAEAARARVPATALAREAIDAWLRHKEKTARDQAITEYAAEMAGSDSDLDPELETAGIQHLVKTIKR